MSIPKVGDPIYIPSEGYIGHGEDDVAGGLATISKVDISDCKNEYNRIFVSVEEVPSCKYNYLSLIEKQDELCKEYGDKKAHLDPDYNNYGEFY